MLDFPSSATTGSVSVVEMLPYCRAPAGAAAAAACAACCGRLTLARSSSVILSAGLSSVLAIVFLPGFCRLLLLGLRRWLWARRCCCRARWSERTERIAEQSGLTRLKFRLTELLHFH